MSRRSIKMVKLEDGDYVPKECCTFCRNFETGEMEIDDVSLPCGGDCSCGGEFEDSCKNCTIQEIMNEYGRQKEHGWIPVDERLPEEDGRYLVTFKNGIKVCMVGYGSCKRTVLGYPIGHGWYSLEEAQYYAEDSIIAWMPLPEPYKED